MLQSDVKEEKYLNFAIYSLESQHLDIDKGCPTIMKQPIIATYHKDK